MTQFSQPLDRRDRCHAAATTVIMMAKLTQGSLPETRVTTKRQGEWQTNSDSARRTEALGAALGALLAPGDVICLSGALGAGKTVFSRGIGAGWGATVPLTSPTYNLAHEHERPADMARLYHLDCYRLDGAREAELLGVHEILEDYVIVIFEWPERVLDILPDEHLWIDFSLREDDGRDLRFSAIGARHLTRLNELRRALG